MAVKERLVRLVEDLDEADAADLLRQVEERTKRRSEGEGRREAEGNGLIADSKGNRGETNHANAPEERPNGGFRALLGKYAHLPISSYDSDRRGYEDRLLEEEQEARRARGEG